MVPATSSFARGWLVPMPTFNVPGCMKRDVIGADIYGLLSYYKK
jgi:hypothetical protein